MNLEVFELHCFGKKKKTKKTDLILSCTTLKIHSHEDRAILVHGSRDIAVKCGAHVCQLEVESFILEYVSEQSHFHCGPTTDESVYHTFQQDDTNCIARTSFASVILN